MTGKDLYPLVYRIVTRAQKQNLNLKNHITYYNWSLRIPNPSKVSDDLSNALCSSVSSSLVIGLEIYFQEMVYIDDLEATKLSPQLNYLLSEKKADGINFGILGEIIRTAFEGRKVPNDNDMALLNAI